MRQFLRLGNASYSKINYVNWATITLPKAEGGPGIRKISEVNAASIIKLDWQASTETSLWSQWFKNRCFKYKPIWSPANTIYGSCIWKKPTAWLLSSIEGVLGFLEMIKTLTSGLTLGMKIDLSLIDILFCNSLWIKGFLLCSNMNLGPSLPTCGQQLTTSYLLNSQTSPQVQKSEILSGGETHLMASSP